MQTPPHLGAGIADLAVVETALGLPGEHSCHALQSIQLLMTEQVEILRMSGENWCSKSAKILLKDPESTLCSSDHC